MSGTTDSQSSSAVLDPQPIRPGRGATILGPRNVPVEVENPDVLVSPETDAGTVQSLKWPFALSHNRVLSGGWARETTTRELPISTEICTGTKKPSGPT
jgi:oxalate decarboxylase